MNQAIFCEIQHGRCEQRDLVDFAAMTSRENPLLIKRAPQNKCARQLTGRIFKNLT